MTLGRSKPSSRGAVSNPTGRFEPLRYAPLEEGPEDSGDEAPPIKTTVTPERVRSIISRNDSPDVPFELSVNPYILVRLPREVKDLFSEWLEAEYPDRAARVLSLVRQTHGGNLYDSRFGARGRGAGPYADLLQSRFAIACARLGLSLDAPPLDTTRFRVPPDPEGRQRSLCACLPTDGRRDTLP